MTQMNGTPEGNCSFGVFFVLYGMKTVYWIQNTHVLLMFFG